MTGAIHVQVCAGLGNRIRAMISAICLAEDLGRKLILHWVPEAHCNCRFETIFDIDSLPLFIHVVKHSVADAIECLSQDDTNSLLEYAERTHIDIFIKSYGKFYSSNSERWLEHLRRLKPSALVSNLLEQRLNGVDMNETIGIHIRRGDNRKAIEASPLEAYDKILKNYSNKTYVISSDDWFARSDIYKIVYPSTCIFLARHLDRTSEVGMIEAAVDFFGLARCSKIIGSFYSSFSDIAAQYGGKELILAKKD